jgi:hypothetical protein
MSESSGQGAPILPLLTGALAGALVMGCCGGPVFYSAEKRSAAQAQKGWRLVPEVVAAHALRPGQRVVLADLSQRALPERFVTSSIVKPDSASYIVGQPIIPGAEAGDPMLWSSFETELAGGHRCVEAVDRVQKQFPDPSPELSQLIGAIRVAHAGYLLPRPK